MTKEEMYDKYKALIPKVIRDMNCYYRTTDEYQELYDSGQIGLLQAINTFDFSKKATSTYMYACIKRNIMIYFHSKQMLKRKVNYLNNISIYTEVLEGKCLYEFIEDYSINVEKEIITNDNYKILYKAIDMLKPSYKEIIIKYFGINCLPKTLEQIAKEKNVSRQAINVKKNNALKELKQKYLKLGGVKE